MEENFFGSAMVRELVVEEPELSVFLLFNIIATFATATFCVKRFIANNYILARLSFVFLSFICLFYQFPLTIFSRQVEASVNDFWGYSLVVNGGAILLMCWLSLTRRLDLNQNYAYYPEKAQPIYIATGGFSVVFLGVYLSNVSWNCTGLYALIFDPSLTLLAREFSVKLIGTSFATYSLGAYANAAAPIFILFSVWFVRRSLLSLRIARLLVGVLVGLLSIAMVLLSGTKGLLAPTMLMLIAGAYFWCKTWRSRIITATLSVAFIVFSLVLFVNLTERSSIIGENYDFAVCSANAGTCHKSQGLLESMKARQYSLGMHETNITPILSRLQCVCSQKGDMASCSSAILTHAPPLKFGDTAEVQSVMQSQTVASSIISSILNRVFIVPFRVSIWHFMYAESESVAGEKTLPFARRLFGDSLNMPELVYQKYGVIYSGGDTTSTSTAPTSFFLSYSAYLGLTGFILALFCLILLDFVLSRIANFIGPMLSPLLIGLVMIMCMNFMMSDFVTVLISHGGIAGISMLLVYALIVNITNGKRFRFLSRVRE